MRTKLRAGVCEILLLDVVVPELKCIRTLAVMCVSSAYQVSIHYARIKHSGSYMQDLQKPQNCQSWVVGAYVGMGACLGQYSINTL